jgi:hypothetical protein
VLNTVLNPGRTYTLTDNKGDSSAYYQLVRELADSFLDIIPSEVALREMIRNASTWKDVLRILSRRGRHVRKILRDLDNVLAPFLTGVNEHLRTLSLADRLDRTMRTSREQYLIYMLEIELTNRINREKFSKAPWRMALIAHCLRDFKKGCQSIGGDIEDQCTGCDLDCYVNMGSELLKEHQIHPYISVSMDHQQLFRHLKEDHPDMGVIGIACIPELVAGMRLCEGFDIPAIGVPLDANRCSRWFGECLETTFNIQEMEKLIKPVPGA